MTELNGQPITESPDVVTEIMNAERTWIVRPELPPQPEQKEHTMKDTIAAIKDAIARRPEPFSAADIADVIGDHSKLAMKAISNVLYRMVKAGAIFKASAMTYGRAAIDADAAPSAPRPPAPKKPRRTERRAPKPAETRRIDIKDLPAIREAIVLEIQQKQRLLDAADQLIAWLDK